MALIPANVGSEVVESEKLAFMVGLSNAKDAKGIILPNVGYYDEKSKSYLSGVKNPENVNENSIRRVSIDLGEGKTKYFQQIDYRDGNTGANGFKATAWQEIDKAGKAIKVNGKQEIRLYFTGITGQNDTGALQDFIGGKLNPQAVDAADFTNGVIQKMGKDNISHFITGTHSLGTGNALAAKAFSDLKGIPTETLLAIEPVGATLQLNKLKQALLDENSPFFKKLESLLGKDRTNDIKKEGEQLDKGIAENTISIQAVKKDDKGDFHSSAMANVMPGFGQSTGWTAEIDRRLNGKDYALQGKPFPNNVPIGQSILQDISSAAKMPNTSLLARLDEVHMAAPMIASAEKGKYYVTDTIEIIKPTRTPTKTPTPEIITTKR